MTILKMDNTPNLGDLVAFTSQADRKYNIISNTETRYGMIVLYERYCRAIGIPHEPEEADPEAVYVLADHHAAFKLSPGEFKVVDKEKEKKGLRERLKSMTNEQRILYVSAQLSRLEVAALLQPDPTLLNPREEPGLSESRA